MKHIFTVLLFVFSLVTFAMAQITFTYSDAASLYGESRYTNRDTTVKKADIGHTGGDNVWDFSAMTAHSSVYYEYMAASATPFAADFPTASLAMKSLSPIDKNVSTDFYSYLSLSESGYEWQGGEMSFMYYGYPMVNKVVNTPAEKVMVFPATYNTSWTASYLYAFATLMNGTPMSTNNQTHTTTYTIDAYGTLKIPGGNTAPALRIKKDDRYVSSVHNNYYRHISYQITTKNNFSVSIDAADTVSGDNGIINVEKVSWSSGQNSSDVENGSQLPTEYSLSQNYPNPFNPSATIEFQMPEASNAVVTVYDVLGKVVSTLFDGYASAGTHKLQLDGKNLNSGVYFYRLQTKSFSTTRKAVLLK